MECSVRVYGIADDPDGLREMLETVLAGDPERIWVEPVNPRGMALSRQRTP